MATLKWDLEVKGFESAIQKLDSMTTHIQQNVEKEKILTEQGFTAKKTLTNAFLNQTKKIYSELYLFAQQHEQKLTQANKVELDKRLLGLKKYLHDTESAVKQSAMKQMHSKDVAIPGSWNLPNSVDVSIPQSWSARKTFRESPAEIQKANAFQRALWAGKKYGGIALGVGGAVGGAALAAVSGSIYSGMGDLAEEKQLARQLGINWSGDRGGKSRIELGTAASRAAMEQDRLYGLAAGTTGRGQLAYSKGGGLTGGFDAKLFAQASAVMGSEDALKFLSIQGATAGLDRKSTQAQQKQAAFSLMTQAEIGTVSLEEMAPIIGKVVGAMTGKGSIEKKMTEGGAMVQFLKPSLGSAAEAATAVQNVFNKMKDPKARKALGLSEEKWTGMSSTEQLLAVNDKMNAAGSDTARAALAKSMGMEGEETTKALRAFNDQLKTSKDTYEKLLSTLANTDEKVKSFDDSAKTVADDGLTKVKAGLTEFNEKMSKGFNDAITEVMNSMTEKDIENIRNAGNAIAEVTKRMIILTAEAAKFTARGISWLSGDTEAVTQEGLDKAFENQVRAVPEWHSALGGAAATNAELQEIMRITGKKSLSYNDITIGKAQLELNEWTDDHKEGKIASSQFRRGKESHTYGPTSGEESLRVLTGISSTLKSIDDKTRPQATQVPSTSLYWK